MFRINLPFESGWGPMPPGTPYAKMSEAKAAIVDFITFTFEEAELGYLPAAMSVYDFYVQSDGDFEGVEVGAREYAAENGWQLVWWDGNPDLNYMCWRKSFGHGHIDVGCGVFDGIVHSFGANSQDSFSSTRIKTERDTIVGERQGMIDTDNWWKKNREGR